MGWQIRYRSLLTTAAAAVSGIATGQRVYIGGNAATPQALARALARRVVAPRPDEAEIEDLSLGHVLLLGDDPLAAARHSGKVRHMSWFVGPADRDAVQAGESDYVPVHLHQIPRLLRSWPLDVALLMVSPPDAHGYMSLGVEVLASMAAARSARRVVVQVNEHMPRVHGDAHLHVAEVNAIVEAHHPLPELAGRPPSEVERRIAGHIAPLIEDGATLQLGIGGIPDAVLPLLADRRDLGVHTEMMSDGVMRAIESGLVNGRRKSLHPGKVITTFCLGTRDLYRYVDDNPLIQAHPADYVNDPFVIAQNKRMVALNSALSVDLTGQVNSDSIGPRIYSGFGGQVDFIRGAAASRGGLPIIALPSTAKGGRLSRIVGHLALGAGVVTTRADVHWVVTEYGAVNLFGASLRERAEKLISIAHPDFRAELSEQLRARRAGQGA